MRHPSRLPATDAGEEAAAPSTTVRRTGKSVPPPSLIDALKNSATHNDQIIQRRIGAQAADEIPKVSRQVERSSCPEE